MSCVFLVLATVGSALADPVVTFDPPTVRFGVQPFEELTVDDVTVTNAGAVTLVVTVNPQLPDDFSSLIDSTCPHGQPITLAPGESCVQVVGFRPTEFFAPREVATARVTATDPDGNVVFDDEVRFVGYGVPRERIVDLSEPGVGTLDPDSFATDFVRFVRGDEVVLVQGDEAVVGPVRFVAAGSPVAATVTFAPTAQGAAWYQLTAHGARGEFLGGTRALVTQDDGAAVTDPPGYVTLALVEVPLGTRSLSLTNRFVGSSYPGVTEVGFAVSEVRLFADPID